MFYFNTQFIDLYKRHLVCTFVAWFMGSQFTGAATVVTSITTITSNYGKLLSFLVRMQVKCLFFCNRGRR